jgi:hypothetical protein
MQKELLSLTVKDKKITRRRFMQLAATVGLSAALAACQRGEPTPTPYPAVPSDYADTNIPQTEPYTIPDVMHETAERTFSDNYQNLVSEKLIPLADGSLYALHNPDGSNASMEMQGHAEIFAAAIGDSDTLDRLIAFDNHPEFIKPNGLRTWEVSPHGNVLDHTSVADTMITLATARILSNREHLIEEGIAMATSIKDNLVNPQTRVIRAFDSADANDLTNPSYWSRYLLQIFAEHDPDWIEIGEASDNLVAKVRRRVENGDYASFPKWVNMDGEYTQPPWDHDPAIAYDTTRIPPWQMLTVNRSTDPNIRNEALRNLQAADRFYYSKILQQDGSYDIQALLDGYNIDGTLYNPDGSNHWPLTAFASAAAAAAMVSPDNDYQHYMIQAYPDIPTDYPFNAYLHTWTALSLTERLPVAG